MHAARCARPESWIRLTIIHGHDATWTTAAPGDEVGAVLKTYDVFLSHATRLDRDTFTENTVALVYASLRDRGLRVFWDRVSLSSGEPLVSALREAIAQSRVVATFLSPAARDSSWVEFECEQARFHAVPLRAIVRAGSISLTDLIPSELICLPEPPTEEGAARTVCDELLRLLRSA
jgi:hypothetical protein